MIYYVNNKIYDWNFEDDNIVKVYRDGVVCYYKMVAGSTAQTPCYAVTDDITQYSDTEFIDVYDKATSKWYKLNNLNDFEEYGVYGEGRNITYYEGKLTIDTNKEYIYSGSGWTYVGDVSGKTSGFVKSDIESAATPYSSVTSGNKYILTLFNEPTHYSPTDPRYMVSYKTVDGLNYLNNLSGHNGSAVITDDSIIDSAVWEFEATTSANTFYIKNVDTNEYFGWQGRNSEKAMYLVPSANKIPVMVTTLVKQATMVEFPALREVYSNGTSCGGYTLNDLYNRHNTFNWWGDGCQYGGYGNGVEFYKVLAGVEYPLYYTVKQDPPQNLVFADMAEAEAYRCPYVGLKATIGGEKYIFNANYEWEKYGLPSGYTEVEYVQSTGRSSVNLGVHINSGLNDTYTIVFDNEMTYESGFGELQTFLACQNEQDYHGWSYRFDWSGTFDFSRSSMGAVDVVRTNISANTYHNVMTCVGVDYYLQNNNPIALFSGLDPNLEPFRFVKGKLYNMQITLNDVLIADFVPAKRDNDDVYGVYDKISNVFYTTTTEVPLTGGNAVD